MDITNSNNSIQENSSASKTTQLTPLQEFLSIHQKEIKDFEEGYNINNLSSIQVEDIKYLLTQVKNAYENIIKYLTKHDRFYSTKISSLQPSAKIISKNYIYLSEEDWENLADFGFKPNYSIIKTSRLKTIIEFMSYKVLTWLNYHKTKNSLALLNNTYSNRRLLRYIKAIAENFDILSTEYKQAFNLLNDHQLKAIEEKGLTKIKPQIKST